MKLLAITATCARFIVLACLSKCHAYGTKSDANNVAEVLVDDLGNIEKAARDETQIAKEILQSLVVQESERRIWADYLGHQDEDHETIAVVLMDSFMQQKPARNVTGQFLEVPTGGNSNEAPTGGNSNGSVISHHKDDVMATTNRDITHLPISESTVLLAVPCLFLLLISFLMVSSWCRNCFSKEMPSAFSQSLANCFGGHGDPHRSVKRVATTTPGTQNATSLQGEKARDSAGNSPATGTLPVADGQDRDTVRFAEEFFIDSSDKRTRSFRWITPAAAISAKLPQAAAPFSQSDLTYQAAGQKGLADLGSPLAAPWTLQNLTELLQARSVDVSSVEIESRQNLVASLAAEESFLMENLSGQLRHVIDFTELIITHPVTGHVLLSGASGQSPRDSPDCSVSSESPRDSLSVPRIWKKQGETHRDAVTRYLQDHLNVPSASVNLEWEKVEQEDSEEASNDIPGLTTVVIKRILTGSVASTECLRTDMIWKPIEKVPQIAKYRLSLRTKSEVEKGKGKGKGARALRKASSFSLQHNDNLKVLLPWTETEVKALLDQYQIEAEAFAMSLQELSTKASTGMVQFLKRTVDAKLVCIRQEISLRLISSDAKAVLIETAGETKHWTNTVKRLDEDPWDAVRRLCRVNLGLTDGVLAFNSSPPEVDIFSEHTYDRLVCSSVISAYIPESKKALADVIHAAEF